MNGDGSYLILIFLMSQKLLLKNQDQPEINFLVIFFNLNEKAVGIVLLILIFLGLIITIIKILIRLFKKSNVSQKN